MKKIVQLFLWAVPLVGHSQSMPSFLDHIAKDSSETIEITEATPGTNALFNPSDDIQAKYMRTAPVFTIWTTRGLLAQPDGTGRVYLVKKLGTSYSKVRLDSTIYFGYNFGSFPFVYNGELYSFGGYGHWQYNGQLRRFVREKAEWELVPANKKVRYFKGLCIVPLIWFDKDQAKLWVGQSAIGDEGIRGLSEKNSTNDTVYVLDLKRLSWDAVGIKTLPLKNLSSATSAVPIASTEWGQLVVDRIKKQVLLLDYTRNGIYQLKQEKADKIQELLTEYSILYFKKGWLFVTRKDYKQIDSVKIGAMDFQSNGSTLHQKHPSQTIQSSSGKFIAIIAVAAIALSFVVIFIWKRAVTGIGHSVNQHTFFSTLELEVLRTFYKKYEQGGVMTIEELNDLLGVGNKPSEIQKKHRSDFIINVNKKWNVLFGFDQVILRTRSEVDKRTYEYMLRGDQVATLLKILF